MEVKSYSSRKFWEGTGENKIKENKKESYKSDEFSIKQMDVIWEFVWQKMSAEKKYIGMLSRKTRYISEIISQNISEIILT